LSGGRFANQPQTNKGEQSVYQNDFGIKNVSTHEQTAVLSQEKAK